MSGSAALRYDKIGASGVTQPLPPQSNVLPGPGFQQREQNATGNLAEDMTLGQLSEIGERVKRTTELDDASRKDWLDSYDRALDLVSDKTVAKSYPMPKAANIKYPLLITAALQFAARAYPAIVQPGDVVKMRVEGLEPEMSPASPNAQQPPQQPTGPAPGMGAPQGGNPQEQMEAARQQQMAVQLQMLKSQKTERGQRVGRYMSWQLRSSVKQWEEETDKLVHQLPIVGCAFRKVFWDAVSGKLCSVLYSARDVIVNNQTRCMEDAPRITQRFLLYPHQLQSKIRAGVYRDVAAELFEPEHSHDDDQAPFEMYEQHCRWDLDGDGYDEPYIVTIHKNTGTVCRIEQNWDDEDVKLGQDGQTIVAIEPDQIWIKYDFIPDPSGGFYGVGFGHLLRGITDTIDTLFNLIVDAAHLQTVSGGFIGKGLRFGKAEQSSQLHVAGNRWHYVNQTGGSLRDSIVPMTAPGPSPVLFQALGLLLESGKELAGVKDVLSGSTAGMTNMPVGTMMALTEQGLAGFTAIYKRIYRSMGREFEVMFGLNGKHMDPMKYAEVTDDPKAHPRDFATGDHDITPVADPTTVTDVQRMNKVGFLTQFLGDPRANGQEILRRAFSEARVPDPEKLIAPPDMMQQQMAKIGVQTAQATLENTQAETQFKRAQSIERVSEAAVHQVDAGLANDELRLRAAQILISAEQVDRRDAIAAVKVTADAKTKAHQTSQKAGGDARN